VPQNLQIRLHMIREKQRFEGGRPSVRLASLNTAAGTVPPLSNGDAFAPVWRDRMTSALGMHVPVTLSDVIALYISSRQFQGLALTSQKSYSWLVERIDREFGDLLITDFAEKGARTVIRQWRDKLMSHPTSADRTIAMFRLILNFAVSEEFLTRNPLAGIGTVHKASRRDIIWTDQQISKFLREAPRHLSRALLLAIWTGQRQSDLISLKWSDYDGRYIRLQQQKLGRGSSGRRVKVLVSRELRKVLEDIREEQAARAALSGNRKVEQPDVILTTARGRPWRKGFKSAWRIGIDRVGISGVTFHDLRGTFITLAYRSGSSIREIAEASGHDEKECEAIIRKHYLSTGAEMVISRLESAKQFIPSEWKAAEIDRCGDATHRFTGPRHPRAGAKIRYS
jgi:integrase